MKREGIVMSKDLQDMTLEELEELSIELEVRKDFTGERASDIAYRHAVDSEIYYRKKQSGHFQDGGGTKDDI
jgi:hypothetical protein